MALILDVMAEILRRPTSGAAAFVVAMYAVLLFLAAIAGLSLGWAWRPRWAANLLKSPPVPPEPSLDLPNARWQPPSSSCSTKEKTDVLLSSPEAKNEKLAVKEEDMRHLCRLVEGTDGGPAWHKMMHKSLPNMSYQAWLRDREEGRPQYRSSTIFEDAMPEVVRDFFWDDEFRIKNGWDDMLLQHTTLEECATTGMMVVQWVRKLPFFCSNREYIIGRRIWVSGRTYYCVTKGVPYASLPRNNKSRRVDLYYSSWCIRPAESKRDGQMTACEVLLFHHEDMGIPWEIAKLAVRQGMWSCVKRIEPGLRAYQASTSFTELLSRCAFVAHINTEFDTDKLRSLDNSTNSSSDVVEAEKKQHWVGNIPKALIIGGAITFLACTLDHRLVTEAAIFGVARRFANLGRRL